MSTPIQLRNFYFHLKFLFNFKKPCIKSIDFLDLVLQKNGLFLIAWQTSSAFAIKITGHKKIYFFKSGFALIKIPDNIGSVELIFSNVWRHLKITVPLKRIEVRGRLNWDTTPRLSILKQLPTVAKIEAVRIFLKPVSKKITTRKIRKQFKLANFSIDHSNLIYNPTKLICK